MCNPDDGGPAAHEFGHALGLAHEHQNPAGGIEWNEEVILRNLMGRPTIGHQSRSVTTSSKILGRSDQRDTIRS